MENTPTITVLMPVYNCELYVAEAIESILNQTFIDFELIIIDDCSTDTTLQIAQSYSDSRIKTITKEKNSGYTNSLNHGLSIARGKYIARMDGDDISLLERFQKQFDFLEKNEDVVVCGTTFQILDTENIIYGPENSDQILVGMLQENKIAHPTVMMRKIFLDTNNLNYNKLLEPAEDYDLWVKIAMMGKFHNLQEVLLLYRIHPYQVTNTFNAIQVQKAKEVRFRLIQKLKTSWTELEKSSTLKAFNNYKDLSNQELVTFYKIKSSLLNSGQKIFDTFELQNVINQIDSRLISFYFKFALRYNPQKINLYLKIKRYSNYKLSKKLFLKFVFKSILFHKPS
jgi:glycosyltransferase involved in cell wall biosynthesis